MKKFILTTVLLLCASLAQAELFQMKQADGTNSYSDVATSPLNADRLPIEITHPLEADQLPGIWRASSLNGHETELTLRSDGSFVLDQSSDSTLHRLFMCGTWQGTDKALDLVIKGLKRQLKNGDIEQADRTYQEAATILSAQRDRIILLIRGEKLIFDRAG
ncbi:MAG: hypothetical protein OER80_11995 [Gammaproteobacteria bacterium]|nr:hypothetical protein [Gammaproteobacteria bacterium]MDH3767947.1 hypothetical protein [Gammaproteobacteria bacterium]